MAKSLLRSGQLADFQAVGENGQTVFGSALQIRETLRLRKQQHIADCLAIPQINDDGARVDWYSPRPGRVISWMAADDKERIRVVQVLETIVAQVNTLSQCSLRSDKTAIKHFGALLEKALQFPAKNHLFLVDGNPVITFWGFVNLNESAREDTLACLRELEPSPEPLPVPVTAQVEPENALSFDEILSEQTPSEALPVSAVSSLVTDEASPEFTYAPPVGFTSTPAPAAPTVEDAVLMAPLKTPRKRKILWILSTAAVVSMVFILKPSLIKGHESAAKHPIVRVVRTSPAKNQKLSVFKPALPLAKATVIAPIPPVVAHKAEPAPPEAALAEKVPPNVLKPVVINIPKNALVMDAEQIRTGSTRFLNGTWQMKIEFNDAITGKLPTLRYQIKNNKGSVRLVHGAVICKAEVFSGLHQSGTLMIKTHGNARCSDKTYFPLPEVSCKAKADDSGVAECTGRYDEKTIVPVTFKKVSS